MTSTISSKESIRHEYDDYSIANDIPRNKDKPTLEEANKEFIGKEIDLPFDIVEKITQEYILNSLFNGLRKNHFQLKQQLQENKNENIQKK